MMHEVVLFLLGANVSAIFFVFFDFFYGYRKQPRSGK